MRRHALDEDFEACHALASRDDLAAVARRLRHQHVLGFTPFRLDQRARGRAADLLVRHIELGDAERRLCAKRTNLTKCMVGKIGATLHVVDARTVGAIAVDPERQPLDEAERMHCVVMAQHQNARCVLAPCRARDEMIAAAVAACDALDMRRHAVIALGYEFAEPVDLSGCVRWRLDLDPAANAVENLRRVEIISGCRCHCPSRFCEVRPMSCACPRRGVNPGDQGTFADFRSPSAASRSAICSTRSTMLRRSLELGMRVKARVRASPSEVARKSAI